MSVEKPNPAVFTEDKGKGLRRGLAPHQLLWLEGSGRVLGHPSQVLFPGRKDSKQVEACPPIGWGPGSIHQAPL